MTELIHYRYTEYVDQDGLYLRESRFYPVRETPCFYHVVDEWDWKHIQTGAKKVGKTRKVSKNGVRRFCYPSKEQALSSYKARKTSQAQHAMDALNRAESALVFLNGIKTVDDETLNMGKYAFMDAYIFD